MAVLVTTSKPKTLLRRLFGRIDDEQIRTWQYDDDGDFTHSAEQWNRKAWMRPLITDPGVIFSIFPPKGVALSSPMYAIYHGRLVEVILGHADDLVTSIEVTSFPDHGDNVGP